MSDGGKGDGRRTEDLEKVRSNWDLIDWGRKEVAPVFEEKPNPEETKMVLIWKSFGSYDVYSIETIEQITNIAEEVIEIVESWKINDAYLKDRIFELKNDIVNCNVSMEDVLELFEIWCEDTEDFEVFIVREVK